MLQNQRARNDSPPVEDPYGGYNSRSQVFFTDKLYQIRKWSLWHTMVFTILTWNFLLISLQLTPLVVNFMEDNIRCKIPAIESTNWTFDEIKSISHYRNATSRCYYYSHDYHRLSQYSFEIAFNMTLNSNDTPKIEKCEKYVLRVPDSRYNYLDKFNLLCTPNYFKMFHFMSLGQIIGYTSSGLMADIYGRRKAMIVALPVSVVGSILTAISPTYWLMYLFTTIANASIHGSVAITVTMFSEIIHYKIRYYTFTFVQLGYSIGNFVKMLLYHYHIATWSTSNYQWVINCFFLVPICTLWLLPESPHWLLCNKHWRKMRGVLNEINYPKVLIFYNETYENSKPLPLISAKEIMHILFKPAFRKKLFLGVFLFALTSFLQYTETSRMIHITNSGAKSSAIDGVCVMINIALIPLQLKNMSRPMSVCCSLLVLAFFYCSTTIYNPYSAAGFVAACICLIVAQNSILVNILLICETFPTRVRATAFGLCRSAGTLIVLVSTLVTDYTCMEELLGLYGWTIYAAIILIAALICVVVSDTGNVPLPDTELQAIVHY